MKNIIPHVLVTGLSLLVALSACERSNPISANEARRGKLVFTMMDPPIGPSGIYTMNLDGTKLKPLAVDGDAVYFPGPWGDYYVIGKTSQPSMVNSPRWSPDEKTIVCTLTWAFEGNVLLLINADGTNKRTLWKVRAAAQRPQWSPEGDKILFMRSSFLGVVIAIGIVGSSGNDDRDFRSIENVSPQTYERDTVWVHHPANGDYQWGPSGNLIYGFGSVNKNPVDIFIVGRNPANELFSFDSHTGELLKRLTRNNLDERGGRLSPNGQYIAFTRGEYGQPSSFFLLSLLDGNVIEIPMPGYVSPFWNWSSDSKKIVFSMDEDPGLYLNEDFYLYMVDTEQPKVLKKLTSFKARDPDLFISK